MPPEQNKKTSFDPVKVNLDPVFSAPKDRNQNPGNQGVGAGVYNTLSNQEFISGQEPRPATPSNTKNIPKPGIRTYKDDIQAAIQANHLSSVNIAIAENEKMRSKVTAGQPLDEKPKPVSKSKVKLLVATAIILIVVGGVSVFTLSMVKKDGGEVTNQIAIPTPLITTEYQDELNTSSIVKDRFVSALSSRLNDIQIPVNNFYNVYLTAGSSTGKRLLTTSEMFDTLGWQAPDTLKRNLSNNYMVGMYAFGQNIPFVILKISSYENVYSGMFVWEGNIEKDFLKLFRLRDDVDGGLVSALTPSETKKFQDLVVANQDTRVLRDENNKIFFIYSILNKDTIIITKNETALKEIINRLNREKSLRR
jgi:hypothetical protein